MSVTLTAYEVMRDTPVFPVIMLTDEQLAASLALGSIRMLEATLRTPQALACIKEIVRAVPEAVVSAGKVRSAQDAKAAA